MRPPPCLRCKTEMQPGLIWDKTYGGSVRAGWGPLDTSAQGFWETFSLRVFGPEALLQLKDRINVITFRCPTCGYLESYAPPTQST